MAVKTKGEERTIAAKVTDITRLPGEVIRYFRPVVINKVYQLPEDEKICMQWGTLTLTAISTFAADASHSLRALISDSDDSVLQSVDIDVPTFNELKGLMQDKNRPGILQAFSNNSKFVDFFKLLRNEVPAKPLVRQLYEVAALIAPEGTEDSRDASTPPVSDDVAVGDTDPVTSVDGAAEEVYELINDEYDISP